MVGIILKRRSLSAKSKGFPAAGSPSEVCVDNDGEDEDEDEEEAEESDPLAEEVRQTYLFRDIRIPPSGTVSTFANHKLNVSILFSLLLTMVFFSSINFTPTSSKFVVTNADERQDPPHKPQVLHLDSPLADHVPWLQRSGRWRW